MKLRSLLQTAAVCVAMIVCPRIGSAQTQCVTASISGSTGQAFPANGGTGTFFLNMSPSGCTPSISTAFAPFVVITSEFSGIVNYFVEPNSGNARVGFITISPGGSSFTIEQQAAPPPPEPAPPVVDMFRYFNSAFRHHFYTTNFNEQGYGGSGGWAYEGVHFHVLGSQQTGSVPLYRYFASSSKDHFYTTDFSELGNGAAGYVLEEIQCYVYPTQQSGTIPLYRYRSASTGEHFYTTNINEVGGDPTYVFEKVQAYVLP